MFNLQYVFFEYAFACVAFASGTFANILAETNHDLNIKISHNIYQSK